MIKLTLSSFHSGREIREMWVRRKDGKNWDVLSLGVLCDYVRLYTPLPRLNSNNP